MPLWMLVVFAICMLSSVLSFGAADGASSLPLTAFVASLVAFSSGLGIFGVRRPVV